MNTTIKLPYLIQRIKSRHEVPRAGKGPVDANFEMDYMGSAEFEFGAMGAALKAMRENPKDVIFIKVEHEGNKAYYIGPKSGLEMATELFKHELETPFPCGNHKHSFKECTGIKDSYDDPDKKNYRTCIGWWAIDSDKGSIPWALFKSDPDGRVWRRAVYGEPVKK